MPVTYPGDVCEVGITSRSRERPWCKRTLFTEAVVTARVPDLPETTRARPLEEQVYGFIWNRKQKYAVN